jgi:hypothetical protein
VKARTAPKGRPTPPRPHRGYLERLEAHVRLRLRRDPVARRHRLALLELAELIGWHQRHNRRLFAAQRTLAGLLGIGERTVRHYVATLERLGLVHVERAAATHQPDGTWRRQTNVYRLTFSHEKPEPATANHQVTPSGNGLPQESRAFSPGRFTESPAAVLADDDPPVPPPIPVGGRLRDLYWST